MSLVLLLACAHPENWIADVETPPPPSEDPGEDGEEIEELRPPTATMHPERWFEGVEPPPDSGDGDILYAAGVIHDFGIELSSADIEDLRDDPDTPVAAMLEWRGRRMQATVRLKGTNSYRSIDDKAAFKIDVHDIVPTQRIDGEKRLTLNNMVQDPTMLREHAYYWMAARLGIPAPRHAYARVSVNGEPYGLYGLVETMDEELIERAFDGDEEGNLYESSGCDFTEARDWFELEETGGVVPAPDDIQDLVDALEAARDTGELWPSLQAHFDVDAVLSYWALETATGNPDGYVYNRHNYLTYHAPIADNWSILPWSTDRSFTREVPARGDSETTLRGDLASRCWEDAACAAALTARIREVLDVWDAELLDVIDAGVDLIEAECEADPRREYSCKHDDIREFVEARSGALRSSL